nr:unnamed protein product [Callosobruchus analis]
MSLCSIIHSGICVIFGYSAFIAFIILENYPSAVLGFIAGSTDALSFFLHYLKRKDRVYAWYSNTHLRQICRLAIIVSSVGLLSIGYYLTMEISSMKPVMPISESLYIPIVWSFIVLRGGLLLMYQTIRYQNNGEPLLLNDEARGISGSSGSSSNITYRD